MRPWLTRTTEQARVERRALARVFGTSQAKLWMRGRRALCKRIAEHGSLSDQQVYWLKRCPPPGLTMLEPRAWRSCRRARWCPFCFVRRVVGEVFRRLRAVEYKIQRDQLELWGWNTRWCYRAEGLEHVVVNPGWLNMGNRTLLKGYCANWTLSPHGSDKLLLRHDSAALIRSGSRWPNHSKRRPPRGTFGVERYAGQWDERSLTDFVLSAFPYPAGWFTADPWLVGSLIDQLYQFPRNLRSMGLLRGTRVGRNDAKVVPGYRPVFR